jgi:hypothetical protein
MHQKVSDGNIINTMQRLAGTIEQKYSGNIYLGENHWKQRQPPNFISLITKWASFPGLVRIKLLLLRTRFHQWGGFFARPFRQPGLHGRFISLD